MNRVDLGKAITWENLPGVLAQQSAESSYFVWSDHRSGSDVSLVVVSDLYSVGGVARVDETAVMFKWYNSRFAVLVRA